MWGMVDWQEERTAPRLERREIDGVPFVVLTASDSRTRWGKRRLDRALAAMHGNGVQQVALRGAPLSGERLAAWGLRTVDVAPLRRQLLPQLLRWTAEAQHIPLEQACVRLRAGESSRAVYDAAAVIARCGRYMALETGRGQPALETWLFQRWGVGFSPRAVLEVCFAAVPRGDVPAILLGEHCARQRVWWTQEDGTAAEEELAAIFFQARNEAAAHLRVVGVEDCT